MPTVIAVFASDLSVPNCRLDWFPWHPIPGNPLRFCVIPLHLIDYELICLNAHWMFFVIVGLSILMLDKIKSSGVGISSLNAFGFEKLMHIYEVRPRADRKGVDLISDALPFGGLWYGEPNAISNAVGYAKFYSRSHPTVIRVFDEAGNNYRD
jgi:hypothetical protein